MSVRVVEEIETLRERSTVLRYAPITYLVAASFGFVNFIRNSLIEIRMFKNAVFC